MSGPALGVVLSLLLLALGPWLAFRLRARGRVHPASSAPVRPVALVLGARLSAPGVPTTLLAHRLEAAQVLLRRQAVERLVLTGTSREVETMRDWLVARGADPARLVADPESQRTLHSFLRARQEGHGRVLVVTNPFHLPRALFLADRAGLEAVGVAADEGEPVFLPTMLKNQLREVVACLRAVWDCRPGRGSSSA